ncbi:hypothetical protein AM593_01109, partial [Mytilus galloprovincialis]
MSSFSFATVIIAIVVGVYGNDCKEYNLTPSDQSLIDMMKHYLHTSRKADIPVQHSKQDIGVTYVRWGKKICPENADIVYTGQAGGNHYKYRGGGSNFLCLPNDPENGKAYSYPNDILHGAEYEIHSNTKPSGLPASLVNKEVPCTVCRRKGKVSVLMIPGRKSCYKGWQSEYSGILTSEEKDHYRADYICLDGEAEPLDNRSSNEEGKKNSLLLFESIRQGNYKYRIVFRKTPNDYEQRQYLDTIVHDQHHVLSLKLILNIRQHGLVRINTEVLSTVLLILAANKCVRQTRVLSTKDSQVTQKNYKLNRLNQITKEKGIGDPTVR